MSSAPDVTLASRLLREQAPHLAGLEVHPSPATGSSNWVFRVGEHLALRLPRSADHEDDLVKETTWLPTLGAGMRTPIPRIEFVGAPSDAFPRQWTVVTWIEGRQPTDLGTHAQEALARTLGEFATQLHALDTAGEIGGARRWGYRCGEPVTDTTDGWVEEAAHALSDLFDPAQVRRAWMRLREVGLAPGPGVWVHTDLSAENVLVDEAGSLAGVIDFGGLGVGDPAVDLIYAWDLFDAPARVVFAQSAGADEATSAWTYGECPTLGVFRRIADSFTAKRPRSGAPHPALGELTEVSAPVVGHPH